MKLLKWINFIAYIAMVAFNVLANILPIGGNTTGQISASYPNLFSPAPITFSIWGLIYLLLGAFVIYQSGILDSGKRSDRLRQSIGPWFALNCLTNIAWLISWHNDEIGWSLIFMAWILITLIIINARIAKEDDSRLVRILVKPGFDLYFGWIIAASIANVSVFLTKIGWDGFGLSDTFWTVVMLLIGAVIGSAAVLVGGRWLSGAAVIWAYTGILIRHFSSRGWAGAYPLVIVAAAAGIAIILLSLAAVSFDDTAEYRSAQSA